MLVPASTRSSSGSSDRCGRSSCGSCGRAWRSRHGSSRPDSRATRLASGTDRAALDDRATEAAHFGERAIAVAGLEVDRATAVFDHPHVEAERFGVERGVLDAIIRREAHDVDLLDPAVLQPLAEP